MPPEKAISINEYDYNILNNLKSDIFTTAELKKLFATACSHLKPIPEERIYQRVYYLTKKLLNSGALDLISCKPEINFHFYKKSCTFHRITLKVDGDIKQLQPRALNHEGITLNKSDTKIYKSFIKRINYHKNKMDKNIYERCTYSMRLGEHPALKKIIEDGENHLSQQIHYSFREIKKLEYVMMQFLELKKQNVRT